MSGSFPLSEHQYIYAYIYMYIHWALGVFQEVVHRQWRKQLLRIFGPELIHLWPAQSTFVFTTVHRQQFIFSTFSRSLALSLSLSLSLSLNTILFSGKQTWRTSRISLSLSLSHTHTHTCKLLFRSRFLTLSYHSALFPQKSPRFPKQEWCSI